MTERFSNAGSSTLSAAITLVGATTLTVTSATSFPTAGNFRILVDSELMLVTAVAGTTFTVTRGAESTTAATHANGATVAHILTAGSIQQLVTDHTALTDPHPAKYPLLSAILAKGALFVGVSAGAVLSLPAGANDTQLIADSTQVSGLRWGTGVTGPTGATGATGPAGIQGLVGSPGSVTVSGAVPYICIQDQKTVGSHGGTFTSGSFQTRIVNITVADDNSLSEVASNRITLPAGRWRTAISCPAINVNQHQARLQNITGSGTLLLGTTEFAAFISGSGVQNRSLILGRFDLRESSALEIQHRCTTTKATDGFGTAASYGTEIYTVAEFWLEAGPPPFFGQVLDLPVRRRPGADGQAGRSSLNVP